MEKGESKHAKLIKQGLRLHERFRYKEALAYFEKAFRRAPQCPAAIFNLASTLHMLDRQDEAYRLLLQLTETPDKELEGKCAELRQPASFKIDAFYLMFHILLEWKRSWAKALPYAAKHIRLRRRGVKSAWSIRTIRREIAEARHSLRSGPSNP